MYIENRGKLIPIDNINIGAIGPKGIYYDEFLSNISSVCLSICP